MSHRKKLPSNKLYQTDVDEDHSKENILQSIESAVRQELVPDHLANKDYDAMKLADRHILDLLQSGFRIEIISNEDRITKVVIHCSHQTQYLLNNIDISSILISTIQWRDLSESAIKNQGAGNDKEVEYPEIVVQHSNVVEKLCTFLKTKQQEEILAIKKIIKKRSRKVPSEKNQSISVSNGSAAEIPQPHTLEWVTDIDFEVICRDRARFLEGLEREKRMQVWDEGYCELIDPSQWNDDSLAMDAILYNPEISINAIMLKIDTNENWENDIIVDFVCEDWSTKEVTYTRSDIEGSWRDRDETLNEVITYVKLLNYDEVD